MEFEINYIPFQVMIIVNVSLRVCFSILYTPKAHCMLLHIEAPNMIYTSRSVQALCFFPSKASKTSPSTNLLFLCWGEKTIKVL